MKRRVVSVHVYPLCIPFVEAFVHATSDRRASDSVLVALSLDDGTVGWGEGVPRPYVTGETQDFMVAMLQGPLADLVLGRTFEAPRSIDELERLLPAIPASVTDSVTDSGTVSGTASGNANGATSNVLAPNASRCALELALVDALLRSEKMSLRELLPPRIERVVYSAAVTSARVEGTLRIAKRLRLVGFSHWKVKVGFDDDQERLEQLRTILGPDVSLRVDANAAWDLEESIARLDAWRPLNIAAVEEPLGRSRSTDLPALRRHGVPPIVVDESFVTVDDARQLIANQGVDIFNLRLSKLGGLGQTLALARMAREAHCRYQLGCQVGETAILSAAGRHVAAHLDPLFTEGSFGSHLLAEDVSTQPMSFGHGGYGALLRGPGLGIEVRRDRVERYATAVHARSEGHRSEGHGSEGHRTEGCVP
jgi:muconate cycloisomerase